MLSDLNVAAPQLTDYDLCVIGTGPAGLSIAQAFAGDRNRVLLLEAGGLTYTEESRALLTCESTGLDAWPEYSRQRFFGGTSNHWAGRCRPFDSSDFEPRQFGEIPGWPIRYSEIEPYLEAAKSLLDIGNLEFESVNPDGLGTQFEPDAFAHSPPTRFGKKFRQLVEQRENIDCFVNANVVGLELNSGHDSVESIEAVNYENQRYLFKSKVVVIALGGIENARFLLNQDKQIKQGIGNGSDMLGKCFMEHLNVKIGNYITDDEVDSRYAFYTASGFTRAHDIGKGNLSFKVVENIRSYGRTKQIKSFFKNLACDLGLEEKVQFIADFDCPGMGVITTLIEQRPGKQSYVGLSEETDALGMRKGLVNWELSEQDYNTIRTIAVELAKGFGDSGLGMVKLEDYILEKGLEVPVGYHAHHMGTTRMASHESGGVVDENCKVFGVNNLYVAGSSIFATGGASNPTMPIIQFALRLSDHLKRVL